MKTIKLKQGEVDIKADCNGKISITVRDAYEAVWVPLYTQRIEGFLKLVCEDFTPTGDYIQKDWWGGHRRFCVIRRYGDVIVVIEVEGVQKIASAVRVTLSAENRVAIREALVRLPGEYEADKRAKRIVLLHKQIAAYSLEAVALESE